MAIINGKEVIYDEERKVWVPVDPRASIEPESFWKKLGKSALWHLTSRRFRTAIGAVIAFYILANPKARVWLGVDEASATTFATNILILVGMFIAALTGEKFKPNGKIAITEIKKKAEDAAGEFLNSKIDEIGEKFLEKMKKKGLK